MKSRFLTLLCGGLLLAGMPPEGPALEPADPGEHRATQRFHIVAGENASSFLVYRQHGNAARQHNPAMTVVHDPAANNLDVFTQAFTTSPRWRIDAGNKDEIYVYRLDRGNVRAQPSYVIRRAGAELSTYRISNGREARYRTVVVEVEPANHRTLVFGTGTGDARLNRAGRRVEHEDLKGVASFTWKDLPLEELTGILGALDMARGT